jgi:hypothetical protein
MDWLIKARWDIGRCFPWISIPGVISNNMIFLRQGTSGNNPSLNEWIAVSYLGSTLNQCWASFRSKGQKKFLLRGTSGKFPRASEGEFGEKFAHLGKGKSLAYAPTTTGPKWQVCSWRIFELNIVPSRGIELQWIRKI